MPAILPPSQVLVTGGTGYIGAWVVKTLLDRGFSVRAVVRSDGKAALLEHAFKFATESTEGKLTFVVIKDPFREGALDEAVEGVEAVIHLASLHSLIFLLNKAGVFADFIKPAVNGTLGVLRSASTSNGSSIKRIVVTSSCAAIYPNTPEPGIWSEDDWNDAALEQLKVEGKGAHVLVKYRASKVLAERAAWEFYEEQKGKVEWDLVVLNPPIVFGPPLLPGIADPPAFGESMRYFYNIIIANAPKTKEVLHSSHGWADVRDIAEAHVRSLEKEEVGGERVIVYAGPFIWQEFVDIVNKVAPSMWPGHEVPKGFPLEEKDRVYRVKYRREKQERLLGLKFRTKEETTRDILKDFAQRGW